jgi:hypothetical protein
MRQASLPVSFLLFDGLGFLESSSIDLILVPLGDWEKNPRHWAKTLVCVRYDEFSNSPAHRCDTMHNMVCITEYRTPILHGAAGLLHLRINNVCMAKDIMILRRLAAEAQSYGL